MSTEYAKYYRIDRYLRGELEGEELSDFVQELSQNNDLAEELEIMREANEMISTNAYHDLRKQMSSDLSRIDNGGTFKKWFGGIFVLATMIAGLGYFLLKADKIEEKPSISENTSTPIGNEPSGASQPEKKVDENIISQPSEVKENSRDLKNQNSPAYNLDAYGSQNALIQDTVKPRELPLAEPNKSPDESKRTTTESDKKIHSPCSDVAIKANWRTESACNDEKDGKIEIDESDIAGGEGPYRIELFRGNDKMDGSGFEQLASGGYLLRVTDKNGCSSKWTIDLKEKPCKPTSISIAPSQGEKWEYDGKERNSYYLSIYNMAGQLVFKSSLLSGKTEWAGTNNSGGQVDTGYYVYIVEYSNGTKDKGQITVIW